jgi:hypothetical protein
LRGAQAASSALNPTVSQTQRSYRIVVPSKVSADNVLEAYKAGNGGKCSSTSATCWLPLPAFQF